MQRWILVSCLLLISVLGVLVPAGAQASTAAAGKLTSGKPVKVTISKPGQAVKFTFAAKANKNVTFNITHFNFTSDGSSGEVSIYFYEPGTSSAWGQCNNGVVGNTYCNFTTPVGGTWKVAVISDQNSVGSLTLTFANDVPTKALTSGTPVTTTIKFAGQEAGYTFAAKANKNVTFDITHFNFSNDGSPGEVFIDFYEPGSSNAYAQCNNGVAGNTYCNFTTPVGGTWKVGLFPYEASVGSLTLTFANDVPTVTLTPGTPVTTTIKFAGQEAGYTFAAKANKNVTFDITHFNFSQPGGPNEVTLFFYEPGTSGAYTDCNVVGSTTCSVKPPVGGTWSAALIPYEANVGSLTLKLA